MQETSFLSVDSDLVSKHDSLASKPYTQLTVSTNKTGSARLTSGDEELLGYQADEGSDEVSGYIMDLAERYESNEVGLLRAYESLYRYGVSDRTSQDTINNIRESNKRLDSSILEVRKALSDQNKK